MTANAEETYDGGWHRSVIFLTITIGDPRSFFTPPTNPPRTNDSQTRVLTIYACPRNLNQPKTDAACT